MIKLICVLIINLLLPGTGFIFYPSNISKVRTGDNNINPKGDLFITLLKPASTYWFILLSALLVISWSGLIFEPQGFYYLLIAYVFVAILSSLHLILARSNFIFQKKIKVGSDAEGAFKPITYRLLPLFFVLIYISPLLLLLVNKPFLLGWQVYQIPSASMFPTLQVGDIVLADTRPSTLNRLSHQDIIIFYQPKKINQDLSKSKADLPFYIKRLIAKGGDRIAINNHQLLLNNQPLKSQLTQKYLAEQLIKPNAFFVVGDNINYSSDSRSWGQLPNGNVVGKFIRVVYRR